MSDFIIRHLEQNDYLKNYLELLSQDFTIDVNTLSYNEFTEYVTNLNTRHQVFVIENNNVNTPTEKKNETKHSYELYIL